MHISGHALTIQFNQALASIALWTAALTLMILRTAIGNIALGHWAIGVAIAASTVTLTYAMTCCTRTALGVVSWEHRKTRAVVEAHDKHPDVVSLRR